MVLLALPDVFAFFDSVSALPVTLAPVARAKKVAIPHPPRFRIGLQDYAGPFTRIHLAWLNWWLKDDLGPAGKGALVGAGCSWCTDSNWEVKSANLP